jgi:hypothetical protein
VDRLGRVRVVALSCVLVVAAGVLLTGVRAWAAAHIQAHCRPAAVAPGTPSPSRTPSGAGQPAVAGPSANRRDDNGWRVRAFQAAGCGTWHHVRTRMRHHRH